jgi:hypothetical protein
MGLGSYTHLGPVSYYDSTDHVPREKKSGPFEKVTKSLTS